jgi:molybdate transport system substrate-binding protein
MRIILAFLLMLPLLLSEAAAEMHDLPFLTVYAASGLTLPLSEIVRTYSANHDITINVTYESSSELTSRIEEGSGADIFIAAHPEWIDKLAKRGMVIGKPSPIISNELAVIAANDSALLPTLSPPMPLQKLLTMIANHTIVVIGDPDSVPLGKYTKESLQQLSVWKRFSPLVIRAATARIALHLIAQGKTVGITYLSDATNNPEVKILAVIPDNTHSPIINEAAVISDEHVEEARNFIDFLKSDEAQKIFINKGFRKLP